MWDFKLVSLITALAFTSALFPVLLVYALQEHAYLPASPKLLLLAGLVQLTLLLLPSASNAGNSEDGNPSRKLSRARSSSSSSSGSSGSKPVSCQVSRTVSSPIAEKDWRPRDEHSNPLYVAVRWYSQDLRVPILLEESPPTSSTSSNTSQSRPACSYWLMLLLSAICSVAADNILLGLLSDMPCYAFSQLALFKVVAMVLFHSSHKRSALNNSFGAAGHVALGVLVSAVCVGQGVFGGRPIHPAAFPEDPHILQILVETSAHTPVRPGVVVGLGILAALLSALASHLSCLAQAQPQPQQQAQRQQKQHLVVQCLLGVLCNLVWLLFTDADLSFLEDMVPAHWQAVLLLGAAGMLSSALSCWPASEGVIAMAYAYQAAVMLSAWVSGLFLQAPQGTVFACSSLVVGMAVLWLHNGQVQPGVQQLSWGIKAGAQGDSSAGASCGPEGCSYHSLSERWKGRLSNRHELFKYLSSHSWAVITMGLLLLTCCYQAAYLVSQPKPLTFRHPSTAQTLAKAGITTKALQAVTTTPFPVTALYTTSRAKQGLPPVTGRSGRGVAHKAAASTDQFSSAWPLCPALTCSRDAACTSNNSSCCAHLHLHMLAFWDAFMYSRGLAGHYVALYDTLSDAALSSSAKPDAGALHLGVSAQAVLALEQPCYKQELWQHGYAFFLQGNTWRLCAHRGHPLHVFRRSMHPARHLTPSHAQDHLSLHPMWHHTQQGAGSQQGYKQTDTQQPGTISRVARLLRSEPPVMELASWKLCSSGAVLAADGSSTVSIDGLKLPRPVQADQQLLQKYQPGTADTPADAAGRSRAACGKLVAELVARITAIQI